VKKTGDGFAFMELLVVLAIAAFIILAVLRAYYKKPSADKGTQKFMAEQGIDTTHHRSILDSVKKTLHNVNGDHKE